MSFFNQPPSEVLQNPISTRKDPFGGQRRFVSPNELSLMTGISTKTLEKWRRTGEGPVFIRISHRKVLYDLEIFLAWMKKLERKSTSDLVGGE
jgi:hypothetical protein